ncbi:unnamed protein product [Echinostoma caproni]|uniref:Integrase catalytic domain-containing protein n=1 Tax=Echinostoma caproni TaxID=27848 RepID=A0A183A2I4_9TREM|nr:unnamed protein product [Echinostoma caproni]
MFSQYPEGKENSASAAPEEMSVSGLQARIPGFIPEDLEFWLAQVEARFKLARVTNQLTNFTQLVGYLPRSMTPGLRDIFCNPPPDRPYDALRDAIMGKFGTPVDFRLEQLLGGLCLGDNGLDTPTKLLSYMQSQAASLNVDKNILRLSWLQALPKSLSSILQYFGQWYTLMELAKMADRVYADQLSVQSLTRPAHPPPSSDNAKLVACVKALVAQVQALTLLRHRPRKGRRTRYNHWSHRPRRPRSRSPSNGIYWYHRRYGDAAKRCLTQYTYTPMSGN